MSGTTDLSVDQATADAIALDSYIFLYPLILMELTRRQMTNVVSAGDVAGRGPSNQFVHAREFPSAEFRDVVRPNFDTLYSSAWLDLTKEPQIITLAEAHGTYYLLPLYDMWSEIFSCPGVRTTGEGEGHFALCAPDWDGELPDGVTRIDAPTPIVWTIGRTEASVSTYRDVREFQSLMAITPLSAWPGPPPARHGAVDPNLDSVTPPLRQVFSLDAEGYYSLAAELLKTHPPHADDAPMIEEMAKLGFVAGEDFDLDSLDPAAKEAFEKSAEAGAAKIAAHQNELAAPHDGWVTTFEGIGAWGTDYLKRATFDLLGLGINLPEDAVYPLSYVDVDGDPYTGENNYVLRFEADALPPVNAFWSLTLYDAEGFQVANELNRFAIGDRDELVASSDGSIELLIQTEEPASGNSNWLPSPEGEFNLCLRLYYPKAEVLDGSWLTPGVKKA